MKITNYGWTTRHPIRLPVGRPLRQTKSQHSRLTFQPPKLSWLQIFFRRVKRAALVIAAQPDLYSMVGVVLTGRPKDCSVGSTESPEQEPSTSAAAMTSVKRKSGPAPPTRLLMTSSAIATRASHLIFCNQGSFHPTRLHERPQRFVDAPGLGAVHGHRRSSIGFAPHGRSPPDFSSSCRTSANPGRGRKEGTSQILVISAGRRMARTWPGSGAASPKCRPPSMTQGRTVLRAEQGEQAPVSPRNRRPRFRVLPRGDLLTTSRDAQCPRTSEVSSDLRFRGGAEGIRTPGLLHAIPVTPAHRTPIAPPPTPRRTRWAERSRAPPYCLVSAREVLLLTHC
jgi:hypothetical protein